MGVHLLLSTKEMPLFDGDQKRQKTSFKPWKNMPEFFAVHNLLTSFLHVLCLSEFSAQFLPFKLLGKNFAATILHITLGHC